MNQIDIVEQKRSDLQLVIDKLLKKFPCVVGVVAVGSVALGQPRIDSDIDIIIFMEPVDLYIIPAESIWCPWDDTFHSIFIHDQKIQTHGIHLDVIIRDFNQWASDTFVWPEYDRAGLSTGWIAFDSTKKLQRLIEKRTYYDDCTQQRRLDKFILESHFVVSEKKYGEIWDRHGPLVAFHRLNTLLDTMVEAIFALNKRWRFFKDKEMELLCKLPWLPNALEDQILRAMTTTKVSKKGYAQKAKSIKHLAEEIINTLVKAGYYGKDPASEAFKRTYPEPGRAWNMTEWNKKRVRT